MQDHLDINISQLSLSDMAFLRDMFELQARSFRESKRPGCEQFLIGIAGLMHSATQRTATAQGVPMPAGGFEAVEPPGGAVDPLDVLRMELPGFSLHDSALTANCAARLAERIGDQSPGAATFYASLAETMTRRALRLKEATEKTDVSDITERFVQ